MKLPLFAIIALCAASIACTLTAQAPQNATGAIDVVTPSYDVIPTSTPPATAQVTQIAEVPHYCTTGATVYLRAEASDDSPPVGNTARLGDRVAYITEQSGWYFVQYNGVYGWMWSQYLTVC